MTRAARIRDLVPITLLATAVFHLLFVSDSSGPDNAGSVARAEDLNRQAILRIGDKNYNEAIDLLEQAIKTYPGFAEAYVNLGTAHLLAGRPKDAVAPLRKGIQLDPAAYKGHKQLGVVYEKLGRTDDPIRNLRKAVALKPDYALGYFNLGAAYLWSEQLDEAQRALENAARLDPGNNDINLTLGDVYAKQKRFATAVAEVKKVADKDPTHEEASMILCRLYLLSNNRDAALSMYQTAKTTNITLAEEMFKSIFGDRLLVVKDVARP